ncbi:hypothetical protein L6164_014430 [Bauhinia variegata]|uniref:Uncharacterized protein n=1 Tax=Bauhinia variegata TaxID=167791 RepID=A0ACB9NKY9_BAUVA|nr:hypothetical protein L6164_014430 [Bauhinia variegata]
MLLRASFLIVASVAAVTVSQMKTNSIAKKNNKFRSPGSDGSHSKREFGDMEGSAATTLVLIEEEQAESELQQDLPREDFGKLKLKTSDEKQDEVADMELLQKLEQYKQRQVILERKLLELNRLKEEQSAIVHLRTLMHERTIELDLLNTRIASLRAETKILQEKKKKDVLAEKQLHMAKNMINEMQRQKDVNPRPVKEQIFKLQQQVTEFHKYDGSHCDDTISKKLEAAKNLEMKVLELKRRNKELELEKREMGIKLATVQVQMPSIITDEIIGLRHANKDLYDQIELLQKNRFDMVQELVYQRWLYTCLMFEVHNHQKQSRKASLDYCSQNSAKELYKKTDALPSDNEVDSVSSNATLAESDEIDTSTLESSSSSQSSSSKESILLRRIKRWKKSKDDSKSISSESRSYSGNHLSSRSLIRRFSISSVQDHLSIPKDTADSSFINVHQKTKMQDSSKPLETSIFPRLKRVSFSDSVKPSIYYYVAEADEYEIKVYENETSADSSGRRMEVTSPIINCNEHKTEKYESPNNSNGYAEGRPTNIDTTAENKGSKSKIDLTKDENVKSQVLLQLVAFFFFILFIVLVYFLNKK